MFPQIWFTCMVGWLGFNGADLHVQLLHCI